MIVYANGKTMKIDLDLDNKCIRIDGTLFHLVVNCLPEPSEATIGKDYHLTPNDFSKKPILVTEDGKNLFEGDTVWFADKFSGIIYDCYIRDTVPNYGKCKPFSSEEKAKEYISNNKKSISYRELYEYFFSHYNDKTDDILTHFKPKQS